MKILLSIHDVCTASIAETEHVLRDLGTIKRTLFVTPAWHGSDSLSPGLRDLVLQEDLGLHGLTHLARKSDISGRMLTMSRASAKELCRLNRHETSALLQQSLMLFEDHFGRSTTLFIPPMWHHNRYSKALLAEMHFTVTESSGAIHLLAENRRIRSVPLCVDFGNNRLLNRIALHVGAPLLEKIPQQVCRISVHPSDVRNGYWPLLHKMIRRLHEKEHTFINYAQI